MLEVPTSANGSRDWVGEQSCSADSTEFVTTSRLCFEVDAGCGSQGQGKFMIVNSQFLFSYDSSVNLHQKIDFSKAV